MSYTLIRNHHLSPNQDMFLAMMAKDFSEKPITLTLDELADRYGTSRDTIIRIFRFLKHFKLLERYRQGGYKYTTFLKKEVYVYLKSPSLWLEQNCKEYAEHRAKETASSVAA